MSDEREFLTRKEAAEIVAMIRDLGRFNRDVEGQWRNIYKTHIEVWHRAETLLARLACPNDYPSSDPIGTPLPNPPSWRPTQPW